MASWRRRHEEIGRLTFERFGLPAEEARELSCWIACALEESALGIFQDDRVVTLRALPHRGAAESILSAALHDGYLDNLGDGGLWRSLLRGDTGFTGTQVLEIMDRIKRSLRRSREAEEQPAWAPTSPPSHDVRIFAPRAMILEASEGNLRLHCERPLFAATILTGPKEVLMREGEWEDDRLGQDKAWRRVRAGDLIADVRPDDKAAIYWAALQRAARDVLWAIHAPLRSQVGEALDWIQRHLDPKPLGTMRRANHASGRLYHWLRGAGDQEKALRRRQAVEACPPLSAFLTPPPDSLTDIRDTEFEIIGTYIDIGLPLGDALRKVFGFSRPGMKRLAQAHHPYRDMTPESLFSLYSSLASGGFRMLASLPEHLWPATHGEWVAFSLHASRGGWTPFLGSNQGVPPLPPVMFSKSIPPWMKGADDDIAGVFLVADMVRDMAWRLLMPVAIEASLEVGGSSPRTPIPMDPVVATPLLRALFGVAGWAGVERLARRWHQDSPFLGAVVNRVGGRGQGWPALADEVEVDGLRIVPLCSPLALCDEGRAMRHCVSSYAGACESLVSFVFSIRRVDGTRVSTAEFRLHWTHGEDGSLSLASLPVSLVQHRGVSNIPPPDEAVAALRAWCDMVEAGEIVLQGEVLRAAEEASRPAYHGANHHPRTERMIGYDPTDSEACEAVFSAYRHLLPKSADGKTRREWIESSGLLVAYREILQRSRSLPCAPPPGAQGGEALPWLFGLLDVHRHSLQVENL